MSAPTVFTGRPSSFRTGAVALLVSAAAATGIWSWQRFEAGRTTRSNIQNLTTAFAGALPLHDVTAVAERCRTLAVFPWLTSVAVYDESGKLMAAYARDRGPAVPTQLSPVNPGSSGSTLFVAGAPLLREGRTAGEVRITVDTGLVPVPVAGTPVASGAVLLAGIFVAWALARRHDDPSRPAGDTAAPATRPPPGEDPNADSRLIHQSLLEHLPIFVYRKDPAGRFIFVSRQYCGLRQRTPAELLGRTIADVEPEAVARREMEQDREISTTGQTVSYEASFERPGEPVRTFQIIKTPVRDAAGRFLGTQVMGFEITTLKLAQAETARAQARFKFIFESAPVGLAWMQPGDISTRVVNRQYGQITGVPNEFAHDMERYRMATHPDDRKRQDELHRRLVAGEVDEFILEKRYILPDGSTRWAILTVRYLRGERREDAQEISALIDITERKRAEAELERLHRQLVDTSREAGMAEVATSVLHNIGNVLNSVNVSATLLLQQARGSRIGGLTKLVALLQEQPADRLADFITRDPRGRKIPSYLAALNEVLVNENTLLIREVGELQTHIEHISDVVRTQQDYATVAGLTEPITLAAVVEDALRINDNAFTRHAVQVTRDYRNDPTITTDRHRVLEILVNVLQNAKNACVESQQPEKRISVRVWADAQDAHVEVADNGIGIAPENLTRIFSHGFTTRAKGHGFGLHSSALSAQALGGALTAASPGPGAGATFTLRLPLKPEPERT